MVAMVPHQHLRAPGKKKNVPEGRLYVNWIATGETLKNVCGRVDACRRRLTWEQNTTDVPLHITTMAYDEESTAGQMNFTQNSIEAHHRRSFFG